MRKRERENPCGVCGHYHKHEEGEICGICGHRVPGREEKLGFHISAFPSEVLPQFLYLGSYDHASRAQLLMAQGVTHILNTVPSCQNLYKNSFTYLCLQEEKVLQFEEATKFLDQCEKGKARVLVHCMSGKSRSPAIVIAYLMKSKGWRLQQSYEWVKEKRPSIELTPGVNQQLHDYEQKIYGSAESSPLVLNPVSGEPFGFGFQKSDDANPLPAFSNLSTKSISENAAGFTFGAGVGPPANGDKGQMES